MMQALGRVLHVGVLDNFSAMRFQSRGGILIPPEKSVDAAGKILQAATFQRPLFLNGAELITHEVSSPMLDLWAIQWAGKWSLSGSFGLLIAIPQLALWTCSSIHR